MAATAEQTTDTAAADAAAAEKATADKAAADKVIADKAITDKAAADEAATKAAAEKAAADAEAATNAKGKADGESQSKAPDKYSLTVADDAKTAIGDAVTDLQADVEADAKANGWSNEEAQAELDARLTKGADRLTALRDKWLTDTKADTTYGGTALEQTQQLARKAVNALRPEGHARRDSFLRLLNGSGIGNHLEVVSFLADLGKLMGEDTHVGGGGGGGTKEYNSPLDLYK